jgi:hypothetical protein
MPPRFKTLKTGQHGLMGANSREPIRQQSISRINGHKPTSTKWPPVQAQSATVSGSWQAATGSWTAAASSADGAEARRSQVER